MKDDPESTIASVSVPYPKTTPYVPANEGDYLTEEDLRPQRRRRALPILLFFLTCLSTFWAGASYWQPQFSLGATSVAEDVAWRQVVFSHYRQGWIYMFSVLAILMTHEMGHFLATLWYRIPASLPYFIPFPASPLGTMGAVIGMRAHQANRKQIFDIGLAGPIAGLVVAIPIVYLGILRLDSSPGPHGGEIYDCPLLVRWMIQALRPDLGIVTTLRTSQLNAYFMAGWVGMLITGLNMVPMSQLDGGHVAYALFGRWAHWFARIALLAAIVFVVLAKAHIWTLMIVLVTLMGTDHPPTSDDRVRLGWWRFALGCFSLAIPVLCFPPHGLIVVTY
ncbi:MAG: site-2 protease family protein [Planctomycetota bacterium]|nr:site-2 protease family protein [Planctomycetota bacterium]MDA1177292.1 site-2 protease family protein [Planctomycetota bacterium]